MVFSTGLSAADPPALARLAPRLSPGSVYFHFVEGRLRPPLREDDFGAWLAGWGADGASGRAALAAIDPMFGSLHELRERITTALAPLAGDAP